MTPYIIAAVLLTTGAALTKTQDDARARINSRYGSKNPNLLIRRKMLMGMASLLASVETPILAKLTNMETHTLVIPHSVILTDDEPLLGSACSQHICASGSA